LQELNDVATLEYHSIGIDGGTYDYASFNLFRAANESRDFVTEDVRAMARAEGDWSSTPDTGGFIGGAGGASSVGGACGMGLTADVANRHVGSVDATLYRITDIGVAGDASWLFDGIQCPKISGLFGNGYWARDCIGTDFGGDTFVVDGGSGTVILHNCLTGKVRCFSGTMIAVNCTFLNAATVSASQFFIAINCLSYFTHSFDDSFIGVFDLASSNNFSNDATSPGSGSGTISGDPFVGGGDYQLDTGDQEGLEGQGADTSGFSPPVTLDAFGTTRPATPTPGWFELDTGGGTTDGAGSGSIVLSAAAAGAATAESTAAAAVQISGAAVGGSVFSAAGSAAVTVTSAGAGASTHAATGSAAVAVSASAVGDAVTSGSGVGAAGVTVSASGAGASVAAAVGLSVVTVSATGLSSGTVVESVGSATLTVSGSAVGTGLISGVGDAAVAVSGSGSASSVASGNCVGSVVISGAATGSATAESTGAAAITVTATAVSSGLIRPDPPTITTWSDDPDAPAITAWADGADPPIIISWALNAELPIAA
jgi:hypothetical protein